MIVHLDIFFIIITTVYTAEGNTGRHRAEHEDLSCLITKHTKNTTIFTKVTQIKVLKLAQQDFVLHSVVLVFRTGSAVFGIHRYKQRAGNLLITVHV